MTESGLKLLLEKQQSLLKELLDYSQRQFAETDPVGLDNLLLQKDKCFEELQKVNSMLEKWQHKYNRTFQAEEEKLDQLIQDLMEKILLSEKEFEKVVGREKNAVSLQITQLGRQMQYRKDSGHQRPQIKNMKT
tara:strand:+ start:192 stop:593 length:402 start_codon:yes stop_codon:yes gene_type:complete